MANAVVTNYVEAHSIVEGTTAKLIKYRIKNKKDQELHNEMLSKSYKDRGFGFKNLCK